MYKIIHIAFLNNITYLSYPFSLIILGLLWIKYVLLTIHHSLLIVTSLPSLLLHDSKGNIMHDILLCLILVFPITDYSVTLDLDNGWLLGKGLMHHDQWVALRSGRLVVGGDWRHDQSDHWLGFFLHIVLYRVLAGAIYGELAGLDLTEELAFISFLLLWSGVVLNNIVSLNLLVLLWGASFIVF